MNFNFHSFRPRRDALIINQKIFLVALQQTFFEESLNSLRKAFSQNWRQLSEKQNVNNAICLWLFGVATSVPLSAEEHFRSKIWLICRGNCTPSTVELRYSKVVGRLENLYCIKAHLLHWRCYCSKKSVLIGKSHLLRISRVIYYIGVRLYTVHICSKIYNKANLLGKYLF